jgi:hypothetical protein
MHLPGALCAALLCLSLLNTAPAKDGTRTRGGNDYPLSTELAILERDLTSADYRAVVATMIPTDLEAEWQRVATPDNYLAFSEQHGGTQAVASDPALQAAYARRAKIADTFLAMMRDAYKKRGRKAPFDDPSKLASALRSAAGRVAQSHSNGTIQVRTVLPVERAEGQWPRLRGPDGQGTGLRGELPLRWGPSENVVWKVGLSGKGNSAPVIWGDRIFLTAANADGSERRILCYARKDGRLRWEHAAPKPHARESLYPKNTFASSTVVTDGERVIAFLGNSGLVCVDFEGHPLWNVDLGQFPTMHGPGATPVLYKNEVICIQYQNRGQSLFAAFDKQTGRTLWTHPKENAMCWSTPVVLHVGDHDELVYNGSNHLAGYDPRSGDELWHVSGTSHEAIPTIVVGGDLLYSCSGRNGPTMAVRPGAKGDATQTHVVWRNLRGGPHVPSPLYDNGRLYIVNDTGIATCLDAKSGRTVWQHRLPGRFSMSPIAAKGRFLVTNEEGRSFILKGGDVFEIVAENDLGESLLASPALLDGRLYFRTAGHLWCIGGATATAARQ